MACVVIHTLMQAAERGHSAKPGETSSGIFFARLAEVSPCFQCSKEPIKTEQESDPSVAPFILLLVLRI